jgi:hypothetical protein
MPSSKSGSAPDHSEIANVGIAKCLVLNLQRQVQKRNQEKVRVGWRRDGNARGLFEREGRGLAHHAVEAGDGVLRRDPDRRWD